MGIKVKECMTVNFDILPETLSPAEAISLLKAGNYGVVIDSNGEPFALIIDEDLRQAASHFSLLKYASLPPTIIVGNEVEMQTLADFSRDITLFDAGARGAVVMDNCTGLDVVTGEVVVGVLTADAVNDYWVDKYEPPFKTRGLEVEVGGLGDVMLGGSHKTPVGKIKCHRCGFINEIHFLNRSNLPLCQNKQEAHTLVLP